MRCDATSPTLGTTARTIPCTHKNWDLVAINNLDNPRNVDIVRNFFIVFL